MSKAERKKIARELGIRISDVNDDVVSDYRKVTKGRSRKAPNIVINLKETVPAIRMYGGKSYRHYGFEYKKSRAQIVTQNMRKSGWAVRIVPGQFRGKKVYYMYRRKK